MARSNIMKKSYCKAFKDFGVLTIMGILFFGGVYAVINGLYFFHTKSCCGFQLLPDGVVGQFMIAISAFITGGYVAFNAYRSRKMEREQLYKKLIIAEKMLWHRKFCENMSMLCGAEKSFLQNNIADEQVKLSIRISKSLSSVIMNYHVPKNTAFYEKIRNLAKDVLKVDRANDKAVDELIDRIKVQENECRDILSNEWENISEEAKEKD